MKRAERNLKLAFGAAAMATFLMAPLSLFSNELAAYGKNEIVFLALGGGWLTIASVLYGVFNRHELFRLLPDDAKRILTKRTGVGSWINYRSLNDWIWFLLRRLVEVTLETRNAPASFETVKDPLGVAFVSGVYAPDLLSRSEYHFTKSTIFFFLNSKRHEFGFSRFIF